MSLISREPEINNINWPIYSLANYENSGVLLDLCRSSFNTFGCSPTTDINGQRQADSMNCFITSNKNQLTTSGYLTGEESSSNNNSVSDVQQKDIRGDKREKGGYQSSGCNANSRSRKKSKRLPRRCKLLWWQLIESDSQQVGKQAKVGAQLGAATSPNWLDDDHEQREQLLNLCFNLHKAVR